MIMTAIQSLKRRDRKNPKDSLICLKGVVVGYVKAQVLFDNGATLSSINERFAHKMSWLSNEDIHDYSEK
jgi:hypothetical protein